MSRFSALVLSARARAMRLAPTTTEALLWQALSGSKLGVPFRRQVPIDRYIADLCAPSIRLMVEIDGDYHLGRAHADARRDRALARLGYTVVRIPAQQVMRDFVGAVDLVRSAITALQRHS
ncbi:MAG: DUF559 domain-containing protein [Polyangiaceae bacterium]